MESIETKVSDLKDLIIEHYRRLNTESIWFFVATISCWSITETLVKAVAMALIMYYLTRNIYDGLGIKKSYGYQLNQIRKEIDLSELDSNVKDSLLGKLWRIESEYLNSVQAFKLNIKFLLAYAFFVMSGIYFFMHAWA